MTELAESGVALVIAGPRLDAGAVNRKLGLAPGIDGAAADTLPNGARLVVDPGRWALKAPSRRPGDPDAQIATLLGGLNADPDLWRDLAMQYSVALSTTLYLDEPTEETALSPETLALLAARGIALRLEIYAPFIAAGSCGG